MESTWRNHIVSREPDGPLASQVPRAFAMFCLSDPVLRMQYGRVGVEPKVSFIQTFVPAGELVRPQFCRRFCATRALLQDCTAWFVFGTQAIAAMLFF